MNADRKSSRRRATIGEHDVLEAVVLLSTPLRSAAIPAVFRSLRGIASEFTIGQFHDLLRGLHAAGRLQLVPFTGATYQLDGGECCLILGREIMAHVEIPKAK